LIIITIPTLILFYLTLVGAKKTNLILFCICAILFSIGEFCVRLKKPIVDSVLFRDPMPYIEFIGPENTIVTTDQYKKMGGTKKDSVFAFNALGFRGPLPPKSKHEEFRIIMLGGSTVFNGTPLANSIAGQLEQLFHKEGLKKVRVYNWGVVSYVSGQELALILHKAVDYNPDLVVVYDGGNDTIHPFGYDPRPGYPFNWVAYEAGLGALGKGGVKQVMRSLAVSSKLITYLFQYSLIRQSTNISLLRDKVGYNSENWRNAIATCYLINITKMAEVAKGFNFKIAIFLQPLIIYKKPLCGNEDKYLGNNDYQNNIHKIYNKIRIGMKNINSNFGNSKQFLFIDLSYCFSNFPKEIFWDPIHINNYGNSFIANQMFNELMKTSYFKK